MEKWKSPPRRKKKKRSKKGNKNEFYVWSGNTWSGYNPNRAPQSVIKLVPLLNMTHAAPSFPFFPL